MFLTPPPGKSAITAMFLLFSLLSWHAIATEQLPCNLEVSIIAKMLSYDQNLESRANENNTIHWAIVYQPDIPASKQQAEEMSRVIQHIGAQRMVIGKQIVPHKVPFRNISEFRKAAEKNHIGIAYICTGLGLHIEDITQFSREKKVLTIGATATYVQNGVALGVFKQRNKPEMFVNLKASRSEGANFSTNLLKLATVLR